MTATAAAAAAATATITTELFIEWIWIHTTRCDTYNTIHFVYVYNDRTEQSSKQTCKQTNKQCDHSDRILWECNFFDLYVLCTVIYTYTYIVYMHSIYFMYDVCFDSNKCTLWIWLVGRSVSESFSFSMWKQANERMNERNKRTNERTRAHIFG